MRFARRFGFTALLVLVVAWAVPLDAQHGNRSGGHAQGQSQGRGTAQPRAAAPRQPQGNRGTPPPASTQERGGDRGGARAPGAGRATPRAQAPERRPGTAVPRPERHVQPLPPRGRAAGPPAWRAYREPRIYGYDRPRARIPVISYPRAYYSFRPRFWMGLGLWVGLPVAYPFAFGYPDYVYGYPGYGPVVGTPPPEGTYGGLSFDVTPTNATVSVDGVYVGVVSDFGPDHQPLTLTTGRHHIELQAPGVEPLAFDVDIVPGQVIPYRGAL